METGYYYKHAHYYELGDLAEALGLDVPGAIEKLNDDWSVTVEETALAPLFQLSADWIVDRLDDERMSEDGDEVDKISKLIKEHLDFTKVNELMPKLYYTTGKKILIRKTDLLNNE
jgi:hypothetical protein